MDASSQLRIRLEGRLEVLEQALAQLDRLSELARAGWETQPLYVLDAVDAWTAVASARDDARAAGGREPGARAWVDDFSAREQRLAEKLDHLLVRTAVPRRRGLDSKLETWAQLARSLGRKPDDEPLAVGEGVVRSREWMVTLAAGVGVALLHQPLLALLLAPIGVVWWDFCKTTVSWRMFKDCLELTEPERPVRRVPLETIESLDGDELRGLWDLSLRGESGFLELAVDVRRALTERQTRARYAAHAERALWVPASVHVEGEALAPDPVIEEAGFALQPRRAQHGWVLACEQGLVFVPDLAIALAWYVVIGAPSPRTPGDLGAELRALPAQLLAEKVRELGRTRGCIWLGELGHEAFQSLGDILLVVVDAKRKLFLSCPLATQAKLLEHVKQR